MASVQKKRRFKRYKNKSEIYLSTNNNSIKAQLTAYSLKGLGFIIDDILPIASGAEVHLTSKDLGLVDKGKIVWVQRGNSYLEGGIERQSISGLLKHFPLADILMDLQRSEKTGTINFKNGSVIKRIYIKDGDIVFASSNQEGDRLLEVLLRTGKITPDQYYQVIDISEKKERSQGGVLVELGYFKPKDLIWAVKYQVEEIIVSLFQWKDGLFSFMEGPFGADKVLQLKLNTPNLIYCGIKKMSNSELIKNGLPPLETILRYTSDPADTFQKIEFEKADKNILSLINGKRSIQQILSLSSLNTFPAMKILYGLISTGTVGFDEGVFDNKNHENTVKEFKTRIDAVFIEQVENLFKSLNSINHYDFLGIDQHASLNEIKKAYYKAVKEFHPDKHLHLPSNALKNKLNAIFSHITGAYKVLTDQKLKMHYDQELSNQSARIRGGPVQTDKSALARTRFSEGKEALKKEAYAEAKKLFRQAIYLDDSVASYYFYLGLVYEKEQDYREAGNSLNQALKRDPDNVDYMFELGHIYLKLGFSLRAKSTFEKVIKSHPSHQRAAEALHEITRNQQ